MSFELHRTVLAGDTPGTATDLYWYTAGPADAATRIHLQAALHADEQPGTMALHHLLPMLRQADERTIVDRAAADIGVLHHDADDVRKHVVKTEAARQRQRNPTEDQRHHEVHHARLRPLPLVRAR